MSLSGSLILVSYTLLYPLIRYTVSARWKYNILKLSIIFYLIPFSSLKYILWNIIIKVFKLQNPFSNVGDSYYLNEQVVIFKDNNSIFFSDSEILYIAFYILCLLLGFIVISYKIISFSKIKKKLMKYSYPPSEKELNILNELKKEMKIKKEIKLFKFKYSSLILSTGLFYPIIFLPEDLKIHDIDLYNILHHELAHIKHKDILWQFLSNIVVAIHWFNPISYLIVSRISKIIELYSDETTILELNHLAKIRYCENIIYMSTNENLYKFNKISTNFSNNTFSQTRERIDAIMKHRKNNKFITFILATSSFIFAIATTSIYKSPLVIYANEENNFDKEYTYNNQEFIADMKIEAVILPNNCFINEYNQIYEIPPVSTYALCNHTYEEGTQKNHCNNSNGSCTTEYYHAKRCIFCGEIRMGDLYKTETYRTCPH